MTYQVLIQRDTNSTLEDLGILDGYSLKSTERRRLDLSTTMLQNTKAEKAACEELNGRVVQAVILREPDGYQTTLHNAVLKFDTGADGLIRVLATSYERTIKQL